MVKIQFSLTKKIKIGRPERSLPPPTSLRPIASHFYFLPQFKQSMIIINKHGTYMLPKE